MSITLHTHTHTQADIFMFRNCWQFCFFLFFLLSFFFFLFFYWLWWSFFVVVYKSFFLQFDPLSTLHWPVHNSNIPNTHTWDCAHKHTHNDNRKPFFSMMIIIWMSHFTFFCFQSIHRFHLNDFIWIFVSVLNSIHLFFL